MDSKLSRVPLVTIGIAVFNCESYIQKAIESALNQTHSNVEIIVYSDGSTDGTVPIVSSIGDNRIKTVCNTTNFGVGFARQWIKEIANGDYLIWLDADDRMRPGRINALLSAIAKNKADLVIDRYAQIDEQDMLIDGNLEVDFDFSSDPFFTTLFERNRMLPHPLITARCFRKIDFDRNLRTSEDYDFWLKCSLNNYRFSKIDAIGLDYRIVKGSLSSHPSENLEMTRRIQRKYSNELVSKLYRARNYPEAVIQRMCCLRGIFLGDMELAWHAANEPWGASSETDRLFYMGTLSLMRHQYHDAVDYLNQHLERNPHSPSTLNNLGVGIARNSNLCSRELFEKALEVFPAYKDASFNHSATIDDLRITPTLIEAGRTR